MYISEALKNEAEKHPRVKDITGPEDFVFDADGNLFESPA
jgi:hypothetical protein